MGYKKFLLKIFISISENWLKKNTPSIMIQFSSKVGAITGCCTSITKSYNHSTGETKTSSFFLRPFCSQWGSRNFFLAHKLRRKCKLAKNNWHNIIVLIIFEVTSGSSNCSNTTRHRFKSPFKIVQRTAPYCLLLSDSDIEEVSWSSDR